MWGWCQGADGAVLHYSVSGFAKAGTGLSALVGVLEIRVGLGLVVDDGALELGLGLATGSLDVNWYVLHAEPSQSFPQHNLALFFWNNYCNLSHTSEHDRPV